MIYVLYHADCNDGFGAAWAAQVHLKGESAQFLPVKYGDPVPDNLGEGNLIYIVDFSYSRAELTQLAKTHRRVTVLDHHQSAEAELTGEWEDKPQNLELHFEADKSGAVMTWEYLHGGYRHSADDGHVPELLRYIQDRDLWKWELPNSKEINEALQLLERRDFTHYRNLDANWNQGEKIRLIEQGSVALEVKHQRIAKTIKSHHWQEIGGHRVPAVNDFGYPSETCEELCKETGADFAACWVTNYDGSITYSLRSRNGFDVSKVAAHYGGGGHTAAAGFKLAEPLQIIS